MILTQGNSGLFSGTGIFVDRVSTFSGAISNSGTISAGANAGIGVFSVAAFGSSEPGGGIVNTGKIVAPSSGIAAGQINPFPGRLG